MYLYNFVVLCVFLQKIERKDDSVTISKRIHWRGKRITAFFLLILLMASIVIPAFAANPIDAYVNDDEINVRSGPGTTYKIVQFSGNNIKLYSGQYVKIISSEKGSDGHTWYQINFCYSGYSKLGYMRSDYITKITGDDDFCQYLDQQGFPSDYKPYLRALNAASGGKWTFVANKTGLSWNEALEMESTLGVSLVDGSNTALRSTVSGAYNKSTGVWKQYEPGWYAASKETVAFFLDPRSYLVDGTCIAFELLSGNSAITHAQLKRVLSDCKWATDTIIDEFLKAGKEADVNPIFLAVKARNELGTSATRNASGYDVSGKKYYNFFNIGAYGGSDPNYNGILYAKDHGWDTSYKALLGGAQFIASSYIACGQNTQYLQRFNLTDSSTYTHQYATNIRYAYNGGWNTYLSYQSNNLLDMPLVLSVPIFEGMPAHTKLPTSKTEEEYTPQQDPDPGTDPGTNTESEKPVTYDYVSKLNLSLSSSYVSGFQLGTTVSKIAANVKAINSNATVTVKDSKGQTVANSAAIATGYVLSITDGAGTKTYTCVINGDVNGDGKIGATDMLWIKKHILKISTLSGANAKAASFANGSIGATSMLKIKKHILKIESIVQK